MQHLLLLHGAIGASEQLAPIAQQLEDSFHVHLFDFPGHGGKELPSEFSIKIFAKSVLTFLDEKGIQTTSIFGYSMGGYVAMYLAKYFPARTDRVVTLATKFEWDPSIAEKEVKMLQPEVIEQKLPAFAGTLRQRHAPQDWKRVLVETARMLTQMGKENPLNHSDYADIETPSLVMIGDRDKMVSIDETAAVYKLLPKAQFAVLPGTPHPIEQSDASLVCDHIKRFLCGNG